MQNKFNVFEMAELKKLNVMHTPYLGCRGHIYFYFDKEQLYIDEYLTKNGVLLKIKTNPILFENLLNFLKLTKDDVV